MSSSREYLDMDSGKSTSSIKFKAKNGFFVERWVAALLVLLFIAAVVAVGLVVYFLSPRYGETPLETLARASSNDSAKTITDVLLPKTLTPIHYTVELQPFLPPDGNFSFAGQMQLRLQCVQATRQITLHIKNITVHEATVRVTSASGEGATVAISHFSQDEDRQFFVVNLQKELVPKEEYNISMKFLGFLNKDLSGFYRSSYVDEAGVTRWLAVTQFQPTDARKAFPCMDEPALKAKFDITLVRRSNMTSLSNMPIDHTEDRPDDYKADVYETTVNMSTYLLAFVVSDYAHEANNATNTRFSVWARPGAMQQVEYALHAGPKTLDFFETYFNIKFPLPKQDMIAIPDFNAGAMENWGLITYRESALLWDPKLSSPLNKQRILTIIVHELAHQWFGNLVTPKWWDDLWLNEGFASYMEYIGSDHVEPSWKMIDQFISQDLHSVLELDSLESSHPVSVPVNNPDEINEIFDSITYSKIIVLGHSKLRFQEESRPMLSVCLNRYRNLRVPLRKLEEGASVIRMMLHFLGESTFRKGLTNYLKAFSYQNAEQDDLWRYLTEASKEDGSNIEVKSVMDTWTRQTGYPVLTVIRDYNAQTAKLTQKRFFLVPKERKVNQHTEIWHIPITYTTSFSKNFSDTQPHLWFYTNNESIVLREQDGIPSKTDWVIFNIKETAYHRVNYDTENWNLLIKQLESDHQVIDVINRAQLIDDAMDLARASLLDYNIALNVTNYLINEVEYLPWDSAVTNFDFLDQMLRLTAAYGKWKKFVQQRLTPIYEKIGFVEKDTDTHLEKLNRVHIISWACRTGNVDCLRRSVDLYKQWMDNPSGDTISPALKRTVVCYAIKQGDEAEWNFAFERFQKSNVGAEKDLLLSALSCTEKPWILGKYLALSVNTSSGIRKSDSSSVFSNVASSAIGRPIAFDFLRDKWSVIKELHGSSFFAIGRMVKSVTESLNTRFELQELNEFVEDHSTELGTAKRSLQQAIEQTEANVIWMENNFDVIDGWLQDNFP